MPITDILNHSSVTLGTSASRVFPKAPTANGSILPRTHVSITIPASFGGTVFFAMTPKADTDPTDAAIKAAVYGESPGGKTVELFAGEAVDVWGWTSAGTVPVVPHSIVLREASR